MRFRTSPEAPESDYGYCPDCDQDEVLEFVPEWLGVEAHHHCINDDCPSNQGEPGEEDCPGCHERDRRPSIYPAAVRNLAPDNRISITVNA